MSFAHISGDPVLDLLNTVEWRLGGLDREENLPTYGAVLAWCEESGLVSAAERARLRGIAERDPDAAEVERVLVIEAREAAHDALFGADAVAAARLGEFFREAMCRADLVAGEGRWDWKEREVQLTTPRDRIVRGLIRLMGREDLDRLHQCEDATCGWVYLDTSPRRNRRWCVATDCGDRNRARAYYARKASARRAGR